VLSYVSSDAFCLSTNPTAAIKCNRLLPPSELARKELKLYYNWASLAPTAPSLHTKKSLS